MAYRQRIQDTVDVLIARLENEYNGTDKVVSLSDAFRCFAGDVVGDFCFSFDHNFLSTSDFEAPFLEAFDGLLLFIHVIKYFPFLLGILHALPDRFVPSAMVVTVLEFQRKITKQIQDLITGKRAQEQFEGHVPVLRALADSDLRAEETTLERLAQEGITLAAAGQTTVPMVAKMAMFHLFQRPSLMERLRKEIMTVFPNPDDPPPLSQLEQLPYFTAVIMEGKYQRFLVIRTLVLVMLLTA